MKSSDLKQIHGNWVAKGNIKLHIEENIIELYKENILQFSYGFPRGQFVENIFFLTDGDYTIFLDLEENGKVLLGQQKFKVFGSFPFSEIIWSLIFDRI